MAAVRGGLRPAGFLYPRSVNPRTVAPIDRQRCRRLQRYRSPTMASSQVIPFQFLSREVRTLLIHGLPWFVAQDVAHALGYRDSEKMTRNLDSDEKATQI